MRLVDLSSQLRAHKDGARSLAEDSDVDRIRHVHAQIGRNLQGSGGEVPVV